MAAIKTIVEFNRVQTSGESIERARLLASDIYVQQGNLAAAAAELRKFKQSFPNSAFMQNVEVMLASLDRRIARK